jgi:hypothetical protein
METIRPTGPTLEQKRVFYQLFLTLFVAGTVATLLHKPLLMFTLVAQSWMLSILFQGRVGYWAITRSVLAMGVVMYLFARFIFSDWPF